MYPLPNPSVIFIAFAFFIIFSTSHKMYLFPRLFCFRFSVWEFNMNFDAVSMLHAVAQILIVLILQLKFDITKMRLTVCSAGSSINASDFSSVAVFIFL